MTHISELTITRFRGVSTQLRLDLRGSDGKPASLMLVGDNGSGKSTVVDALEFGLQGRMGRSQSFQSRMVPAVLSFHDRSGAEVSITLSDGATVRRTAHEDQEGLLQYNGRANVLFALAPLVLRRSDILRFWDTPDEQKQVLFFDYFKSDLSQNAGIPVPDYVAVLQEQLLDAKRARRDAVAKLAAKLGPKAMAAASEEADVEEWITQYVYKGVTKEHRDNLKRAGVPFTIPVVQHKLLLQVRDLTTAVAQAKRELKKANAKLKAGVPTPKVAAVQKGLQEISSFVTDAFLRLSPAASFVERLELEIGSLSGVSLTITVYMKNGGSTGPRKVFSEANLDLLALLIYVAIARQAAERGQAKVLVLDDVFQSVDGATRVRCMEYLVDTLQDWQLLITVHDRLWAEHVRSVFRRLNRALAEREIRRWSFAGGPEVVAAHNTPTVGLAEALKRGEVYQMCAEAGLLLERASNHLSVALPTSVTRRKDDRYTLGDLWPGVAKALRKTTLGQLADDVERWLHLRNLIGAHHNEWAQTLARDEATTFGQAVLSLVSHVWCEHCGSWVDAVRHGSGKVLYWSCRCACTEVRPSS